MTLTLLVLAFVTLQRLGELVLAKRNTAASWAPAPSRSLPAIIR